MTKQPIGTGLNGKKLVLEPDPQLLANPDNIQLRYKHSLEVVMGMFLNMASAEFKQMLGTFLAEYPKVMAQIISETAEARQVDVAIIKQEMAERQSSSITDMLGVEPLAALYTIMLGEYQESTPGYEAAIEKLMWLFIIEKAIDDCTHMNQSGTGFEYPTQVFQFTSAIVNVIDNPECIADQMQWLADTMETEKMFTELNKITEQMAGFFQKIEQDTSNWQHILGDPIKFFLQMNIKAAAELTQSMAEMRAEIADLPLERVMIQAQVGLLLRYSSVLRQVEQPSLSIQEAVIESEKAILTDTFAFQIVAGIVHGLDAIPADEITKEQAQLIEDIVELMSGTIRPLNDLGWASIEPQTAKRELATLRELLGRDLTPRQLFGHLYNKPNEVPWIDYKNHFARLIKDSIEAEYNTALNPDITEDTLEDIDLVWSRFMFNVETISTRLSGRLVEFQAKLDQLRQILPFTATFVARFLLFNFELYYRAGADYDRGGKWLEMNSLRAEDPFSELDKYWPKAEG